MFKIVARRVESNHFHGETSLESAPTSFGSRNVFRLFQANGKLSGGGTYGDRLELGSLCWLVAVLVDVRKGLVGATPENRRFSP
ncbi:hypothetical protein PanWU01x14_348160 [Parasponia andersonii]|uniref:Uncharacterized protein n=1 Tax=Parasponia andersonii TaxID=3476 RepID=A0A2P5ABQ9_PARAD|nr:hypothetical protein PanWU01x14_348160 [Parasponia andersonii]